MRIAVILGTVTQEKDILLVICTLPSSNTQPVRTDTQHLPAGGITSGWIVALPTAMTSAFPEQAQPKESTFVSLLRLPAR